MKSKAKMFDETLMKIGSLSAEEKVELVKKSLYSDEHMLKILIRILLIVDPGAADDIAQWFHHRT